MCVTRLWLHRGRGQRSFRRKEVQMQAGLGSALIHRASLLGGKYGHLYILATNNGQTLWVTKSPRTEPEPAVLPALLGSLVGSTSIIAPTSVSSQPPNMLQSPTKVILCCTMGRKHANVSLDCTCFSSTGQNSVNSSPS